MRRLSISFNVIAASGFVVDSLEGDYRNSVRLVFASKTYSYAHVVVVDCRGAVMIDHAAVPHLKQGYNHRDGSRYRESHAAKL